jgi:hypothetical protein
MFDLSARALDEHGLPKAPESISKFCHVSLLDDFDSIEIAHDVTHVLLAVRKGRLLVTFSLHGNACEQLISAFEEQGGYMPPEDDVSENEKTTVPPPAAPSKLSPPRDGDEVFVVGDAQMFEIRRLDKGICLTMRGSDTHEAFRAVWRTKEAMLDFAKLLRTERALLVDHVERLDVPYAVGGVYASDDPRSRMGRMYKSASTGATMKSSATQNPTDLVALGLLPYKNPGEQKTSAEIVPPALPPGMPRAQVVTYMVIVALATAVAMGALK